VWAAYAEFREQELGVLAPGHVASFTVMDIDPFEVGEKNPTALLKGKVLMTVIDGVVKFRRTGL
jgi:predicted amidohydrolase YtcJ